MPPAQISGRPREDISSNNRSRVRRHVVVDNSTCGMNLIDHHSGVSQGREKKSNALFKGNVDPLIHTFLVTAKRMFEQDIHANRFVGQVTDASQSVTKIEPVNRGERHGLDHAQATGFTDCGNQFGVAAGKHGAANQRHGHFGVFR